MKSISYLWALALLGAAILGPATAAVRPQPGNGDPHIQSVPYDEEQVVQLEVAPDYQLTLEFSPDEQIENVAVGNSSAWLATPNKRGDQLFVKPTQAGVATDMTVITDARRYVFELTPGPGGGPDMPYVVRFTYPPPAVATVVETPEAVLGRYRVRGARALRPIRIDDDGVRTAITWPPKAAIPVVFALDADGKEVLTQGAMRDGRYVIDDVFDALRFRIGKQVAEVVRIRNKEAH